MQSYGLPANLTFPFIPFPLRMVTIPLLHVTIPFFHVTKSFGTETFPKRLSLFGQNICIFASSIQKLTTMKKTYLIMLFSLMAMCVMAQKSPRAIIPFDDDWQFHLTMEAGAEKQAGPRLQNAIHGWETVQLPHDWSIHMIPDSRLTGCNGHLRGGKGEYKKTFSVPAADKGKAI